MTPAARRRAPRFAPSSLRARLTLSYATLAAVLLSIIFCGIIALATQRYIRSTMLSIDEVAASTRTLIAAHWNEPDAQLMRLVAQQRLPSGVELKLRANRPKGLPPPPGTPGHAAPPRTGGGPPERSLASVFGLRARFIWTHDGDVTVAPAVRIEGVLAIALIALGVAVAVAMAIGWSVGRWLTAQAIVPLTTVTKELRRFARGDFEPSVLETSDSSELGELVDAFNGAAAQVAAAFSERERTEQHLRLFLGEAGHEMRTPLTAISAHLEVLDKSHGDGEDVTMSAATMRTLRGETRRLRELVERVMVLARMEGSSRAGAELVDVVETARDAIAHVTSVQPGDVRLTAAADDVVVMAEPWELQDAVENLVDNALRYGDGVPVDVSVGTDGARVVLRVSNDGPEISARDRAQLFRHFFRGEQSAGKPGSGLGLAIVARAAARLGGDVALENGVPGRTVFRLTIPVYQPRSSSSISR